MRRTRFGPSCQDAVARVFDALPPIRGNGSSSWMPALPPRSSLPRRPSRTPCWGAYEATSSCGVLLHPPRANAGGVLSTVRRTRSWRDVPEVAPDVERHIPGEAGLIRLRRWHLRHYAECPTMRLDVVRMDDPAYDTPLRVGTTACELKSEECRVGYGHRWPVERNFFVAQDTTAMEMPRAWTATALERRISLALLAGSLLKAIAAVCAPQAMGRWDHQPVRSAGRLANYRDLHAWHFAALALEGVAPETIEKIQRVSRARTCGDGRCVNW